MEYRVWDPPCEAVPELAFLGHYRRGQAAGGLSEHDHGDCLEFCYLRGGRQVFRVGGEAYELLGGLHFRTLPHERHDSSTMPLEPGELYWLQLGRPTGARSWCGLPPVQARALFQCLTQVDQRCLPAGRAVQAHFPQLIASAADAGDPLRDSRILTQLLALLHGLADDIASEPGSDPALQPVLRHIAANLDRQLTVAELAAVAGWSPAWFKARFREQVGMAPLAYVQRARIDEAKRLLARGRTVTDVAFSLGFASSQHFATVFKRFASCSPSAFRAAAGQTP